MNNKILLELRALTGHLLSLTKSGAGDSRNELLVRDALNNADNISKALSARPEYTKEMWEAGELPPVGAMFLYKSEALTAECIFVRDGDVYFWNPRSNSMDRAHLKCIGPIQSQEEKDIESLSSVLNGFGDISLGANINEIAKYLIKHVTLNKEIAE